MEQVIRIMEKGPWSFNNRLLVMNILKRGDSLASLYFSMTDFFVHVANAPYDQFSIATASSIASLIGLVKDIDVNGPSLWFRVSIDVTKPLRRVLKMAVEDVVKFLLLQYECLTVFCFRCGWCTHVVRECMVALDMASECNWFGEWLRHLGFRRTDNQSQHIGILQQDVIVRAGPAPRRIGSGSASAIVGST